MGQLRSIAAQLVQGTQTLPVFKSRHVV